MTRNPQSIAAPLMTLIIAAGGCFGPGEITTGGGDANPSRARLQAMPPCGEALATFDGVTVYSNGEDTGGGYSCAGYPRYQCVEFAMRYFASKGWPTWSGNANELLGNAPAGSVDVFYNGDAAHPPVPGDMVMWNGGDWGHVAIVTAVNGGSIDIIEQNVVGKGTGSLAWNGGRLTRPDWRHAPDGWVHAKANSGVSGGTTQSGGWDCARSSYNGQQYWTCAGGILHRCEGGVPQETACPGGCVGQAPGRDDLCASTECSRYEYAGRQYWTCVGDSIRRCDINGQVQSTPCPAGCQSNGLGRDDTCKSGTTTAPTDFCNGKANGLWCNGAMLVTCSGDKTTSQKVCQYGCQSNPPGTPDECKSPYQPPADFCDGKANGLWCNGAMLVTCSNGKTTSQQSCAYGCQSNPPGTPDACKSAPAPTDFCNGKANGLWCNGAMLVTCSGGKTTSQKVCQYGCQSNPPGTPDECKSPYQPPTNFCTGKASGLWCDGSYLVKCSGGTVASRTYCSRGCKQNPPGVADACY